MTGPPAARPGSQTAPPVNRAPQTVLVRMHNGDLAGRVAIEFAETLLSSGAAIAIGKDRLRYVRLVPGIVVTKSPRGWELIEEERRKHGDHVVRRALIALERRQLKLAPAKDGMNRPARTPNSDLG